MHASDDAKAYAARRNQASSKVYQGIHMLKVQS